MLSARSSSVAVLLLAWAALSAAAAEGEAPTAEAAALQCEDAGVDARAPDGAGTSDRFTVAFGSCHHQRKPAPALLAAANSAPDIFVWLGDNLYNDLDRFGMPCEPLHCTGPLRAITSPLSIGLFKLMPLFLKRLAYNAFAARLSADTTSGRAGDGEALGANYAALGAKAEVVALRSAVPHVLATWDDHDYGRNDEGAGYAHAERSRAEFLAFWRGEGALQARGGRRGVYESYLFGSGARAVQLLLLDLRSFRDRPLRPADVPPEQHGAQCVPADGAESLGEYCAHAPNSTAALLGGEQWAWLEAQLAVPAAVRLVGSSLAFASEFHGMEAWSLFPAEQRRLVDLLAKTRAEGVVFLSGDVHYAELSALRQAAGGYPLYDLTSSGLNQDWPVAPTNGMRLSGPVKHHNWGRVAIDWARRSLDLQILDPMGALTFTRTVMLDELRFPPQQGPA